ncbi:MAG: hypothetical protein ACUVRC_02180 [Desulfotomaculales bacterium]
MGERYEMIRQFLGPGRPVRVSARLPGGLRSGFSMVVEQVGGCAGNTPEQTFSLFSPTTGATLSLQEQEIAAVVPGPENDTLLIRLDGGGEICLHAGLQ